MAHENSSEFPSDEAGTQYPTIPTKGSKEDQHPAGLSQQTILFRREMGQNVFPVSVDARIARPLGEVATYASSN